MGQHGHVPMRIDCKNYESRTYPSGETVRSCRLDLAPEAPWRCPKNCPGFQKKIMDGGWVTGSLSNANAPSDNDPGPLDEHAINMLDEAEEIINAIGPKTLSEVQMERTRQARRQTKKRRRWWPFGKNS
jgi:hypothetical protein